MISFEVGGGGDHLDGGSGDDRLSGGTGDDRLIDVIGTNALDGGIGNDVLIGGIGDDLLRGQEGDDMLIADISSILWGHDTLFAGRGNDLLEGGQGADVFIFETDGGSNTIANLTLDHQFLSGPQIVGSDFQVSIDTLDLRAFGYETGHEALSHFSNLEGHATFEDRGTTIILHDIAVHDLTSDIFLV